MEALRSKLKLLITKRFIKKLFSCVFFSYIFDHQNPGSGLDSDPDSLEMLDPDSYPYPDSRKPDPQLWKKQFLQC
jgi:hypothetical protein